jgi:hypothetical protein
VKKSNRKTMITMVSTIGKRIISPVKRYFLIELRP